MKTSKRNLASLALGISVLFAGACAPEVSKDNSKSKYAQLSNGPDLPEECQPCWGDFQGCLENSTGMEACGERIIDCTQECQAPPPPDSCLHCSSGFDACVADAGDNNAQDCAAGFEGCLSACQSSCENTAEGCLPYCDPSGIPEDPNQDGSTDDNVSGNRDTTNDTRECIPEPPPLDDRDQCEGEYDRCFDNLWENGSNEDAGDATRICDDLLDGCYDDCPDDDEHNCQAVYEECLDSEPNQLDPDGLEGNRVVCEEILEDCRESETPPPGDDQPTDPIDPTNPTNPTNPDGSRPVD